MIFCVVGREFHREKKIAYSHTHGSSRMMNATANAGGGNSGGNNKHVLFYSNFCLYSKELLMTITKLDIRKRFILVCVEKHRAAIPPVIDRVPTIVTPAKELITDERVAPYVHAMKRPGSSSAALSADQLLQRGSSAAAAARELALAPKEVFSSSSTAFSYISASGESESAGGRGNAADAGGVSEDDDLVVMGASAYGIFGQEQRIETPVEDDGADDDSTADYERYKASRDADINAIVKG